MPCLFGTAAGAGCLKPEPTLDALLGPALPGLSRERGGGAGLPFIWRGGYIRAPMLLSEVADDGAEPNALPPPRMGEGMARGEETEGRVFGGAGERVRGVIAGRERLEE